MPLSDDIHGWVCLSSSLSPLRPIIQRRKFLTQCKRIPGSHRARCVGCGTLMYAGLTEGSHSFTVRVTDDAGNSNDTTAWAWHVDLPPTCEVTAEQPASGSRALVTKPFDVRLPVRTYINCVHTSVSRFTGSASFGHSATRTLLIFSSCVQHGGASA